MTDSEKAKDFREGFMNDRISNLPGMTETAYSVTEDAYLDPANLLRGSFAGDDFTIPQSLNCFVESSLHLPSDSDRTSSEHNVSPGLASRPTPRQQAQRLHVSNGRTPARHHYTLRARTTNRRYERQQLSTRYDKSGDRQNAISPSQNRRRRCSINYAGIHADSRQNQPPGKKSRRPRTLGTTDATKEDAQEMSDRGETEEELDERGPSTCKLGTTRRTNGSLEWFDEGDFTWKMAGYHRHYRAELIALDAQRPGAPAWTEETGTNYTSFSFLTQGWTKDPRSVVDSKGRQVLLMKKRPADLTHNPDCGPLIYKGLIMLDQYKKPVRDIPGVPLTLATDAPAPLLEGLRRCTGAILKDLNARRPTAKKLRTGTSKRLGDTCLTERVRRWRIRNRIPKWIDRPTLHKIERIRPAEQKSQISETFRESWAPFSGGEPQLGLDDLNSNPLDHRPHFSTDPLYGSNSTFDTEQSALEVGTSEDEDLDSEARLWDRENHIGMSSPRSGSDNVREPNNYSKISDFKHQYGQQSAISQISRVEHQYRNQAYYVGDQTSVYPPMSASFSDIAYSPDIGPDMTMGCIESRTQPQGCSRQMYPTSVDANSSDILGESGISTNAQDNLFESGDFCYTPPETAAELTFVHSMLDYTRAHYKSLMLQEPPQSSSYLATYAEQYHEMQAHLDRVWPFPHSAPPKLRAIRSWSGGLGQ